MIKVVKPMAVMLMMAACVPVPGTTTPSVPAPTPGAPTDVVAGACKSQAYSGLIGRPASFAQTAGITGPMRVIPFDSAVTMDYDQNRINFYLDAAGAISKITCG